MAAGRENPTYAYLDQLSTAHLKELLRADIESPESGGEDVIFHILEVIEGREKEHPSGLFPSSDTDGAWETFQALYNTPEGRGRSLYPMEAPDGAASPSWESALRQAPPVRRRARRVLLAAATVVCLLVLAIPPALGYGSVFQMIARWNDGQFWLDPGSTPNPATPNADGPPSSSVKGSLRAEEPVIVPYDSIQEALDAYGIAEKIVPTWIPEGFKLKAATVWPSDDSTDFNAFYQKGDDCLSLYYVLRDTPESGIYEKDDNPVREYEAGGNTFYIFENLGQINAVWFVETLECSISIDGSLEELQEMIDSIYEA